MQLAPSLILLHESITTTAMLYLPCDHHEFLRYKNSAVLVPLKPQQGIAISGKLPNYIVKKSNCNAFTSVDV